MKAGKSDAPDGMALSKRLASGIKLFFIHDAPLAIEMPASIRNSLLIESEKSISPAVLRGARAVTEASLRDSMVRFFLMYTFTSLT